MPQYRNQSIERTLQVLRCISDSVSPPSLSEVAASVGLALPTALRYLEVLERSGYVERDAATRRYALGLAACALVVPGRSRPAFRRAAGFAVQDERGFRGIVHLALIRGDRLFHVERAEFGDKVVERSCEGLAYDPLASVAGRCLLATLEEPRRERVLATSAQRWRTDAFARMRAAQASVEEHGFYADALADGGVMCLALPVRPNAAVADTLAACITVPAARGAGGRYPDRLLERSARLARRLARALS